MDLPALIGVSLVCAMGAMSPGPSLAVVLRNTISGGRTQGVMTGIGHGIGFGIYAMLAVTGLSAVLIADSHIFSSPSGRYFVGHNILISNKLIFNLFPENLGCFTALPNKFFFSYLIIKMQASYYVIGFHRHSTH